MNYWAIEITQFSGVFWLRLCSNKGPRCMFSITPKSCFYKFSRRPLRIAEPEECPRAVVAHPGRPRGHKILRTSDSRACEVISGAIIQRRRESAL